LNQKGVLNGVATLDTAIKIPIAQIPDAAISTPNDTGTSTADFWSASKIGDELDLQIPLTQKGILNGVATLDSDIKIPISQIPEAAISAPNDTGTSNSDFWSADKINSEISATTVDQDVFTLDPSKYWEKSLTATSGSTPTDMRCVAWSGSVFVTAGTGGDLGVSADGVAWAVPSTDVAHTETFSDVVWAASEGRFFACCSTGSGNQVSYSTTDDGDTWLTSTNTGATQNWSSLAWGSTQGVLVVASLDGGTSGIMTNDDFSSLGTAWSIRTTPNGNISRSVAYSPFLNKFVTVGNKFLLSTDGTGSVWVEQANPGTNTGWESVAWSPELKLFCAVSSEATNEQVATSSNGVDWFVTSHDIQTGAGWTSVVWIPDIAVFFACDSTNTSVSSDGVTWVDNIPDTSGSGSIWSPELQLLCKVGSNNVSRLSVPTIFNTFFTPSGQTIIQGVAWSPSLGKYAILAKSGTDRAATSTNGEVWEKANLGFGSMACLSMAWSEPLKLFCGVGNISSGTTVYSAYSSDGVTWEIGVSSPAPAQQWSSVAWGGGVFCATAKSGTNRVMVSSDGIDWITYPLPTPNSGQWDKITWIGDRFMAVNPQPGMAHIVTSNPTDITLAWEEKTVLHDIFWSDIAYDPISSTIVAVSFSGSHPIMFSTNKGDSWTPVLLGITPFTVSWSSTLNMFMAIVLSGMTTITSSDGIEWKDAYHEDVVFTSGLVWNDSLRHFISFGDGITLIKPAIERGTLKFTVANALPVSFQSEVGAGTAPGQLMFNTTTKRLDTYTGSEWSDQSSFPSGVKMMEGTTGNRVGLSAALGTTSYDLEMPQTVGAGALTDVFGDGKLSWSPLPSSGISLYLHTNQAGGITSAKAFPSDDSLFDVKTASSGVPSTVVDKVNVSFNRSSNGNYYLYVHSRIASISNVVVRQVTSSDIGSGRSVACNEMFKALPFNTNVQVTNVKLRDSSAAFLNGTVILELYFSGPMTVLTLT
jgi:hypothetical protein